MRKIIHQDNTAESKTNLEHFFLKNNEEAKRSISSNLSKLDQTDLQIKADIFNHFCVIIMKLTMLTLITIGTQFMTEPSSGNDAFLTF